MPKFSPEQAPEAFSFWLWLMMSLTATLCASLPMAVVALTVAAFGGEGTGSIGYALMAWFWALVIAVIPAGAGSLAIHFSTVHFRLVRPMTILAIGAALGLGTVWLIIGLNSLALAIGFVSGLAGSFGAMQVRGWPDDGL